ncbi:MAG: ROK family protein, partial [Candidatus Latescibacteria bacterium]|nr:ROK family protein [Candidatus Latescibacterota bacterium]
QIVEAVRGVTNQKSRKPLGVGVGVPGVVDTAEGHVVNTTNLPLDDLPLAQLLTSKLDCLVRVGNDVNVGTLGESRFGAGRGADSVFGIFVGTGIGGGFIQNTEMWEGHHRAAAEVGHMILQIDGPKCGCGNFGCMEAMASRTAIERDLKSALESGRKSSLTEILGDDSERIKSGALKKALRQGDDLVIEVLEKASEVLGYGAASVANLVDPERIVMGGGVIEACGDFMMPIIKKTAADNTMVGAEGSAKVVASILGDDAGVLGAAALVSERPVRRRKKVNYPTVTLMKTGDAEVNSEQYGGDLLVQSNGTVRQRKKRYSRPDPDVVGEAEVIDLCKGEPDALVIGTGHRSTLGFSDAAVQLLKKRRVTASVAENADAVEQFTEASGRKVLLLRLAD